MCYSKIVYIGILQNPWNDQGLCKITISLKDYINSLKTLAGLWNHWNKVPVISWNQWMWYIGRKFIIV